MIATVVLLKVGARADGDIITPEALTSALDSAQKLKGVRRAWIEGDELRAEVEVEELP